MNLELTNEEFLYKFYVEKDFTYLKNRLIKFNTKNSYKYLAQVYLQEADFSNAAKCFESAGMYFEFGRCLLLQGNYDDTKKVWDSINEENSAVLWGRSLLEFINLYVVHIPTFFQIRAFLEVDLDALLKVNLITYCENIVNGASIFAQSNPESYKFIGRVFVNNKHFDLAELFLKKAKDVCYVDPEVHFLLAKCYINSGDYVLAKKSLNTSLEKGFGYYPAKKLLSTLNLS